MKKERKGKVMCEKCGSRRTVNIVGEEEMLCRKCKSFFKVIEKIPEEPMPEPPRPKKREMVEVVEQEKFFCRHCGKDFPDEKKLRRHIGMAHLDKLEI